MKFSFLSLIASQRQANKDPEKVARGLKSRDKGWWEQVGLALSFEGCVGVEMGGQFREGAEGWGHEGEEKREGGGGTCGLCFGKNRSLGREWRIPLGAGDTQWGSLGPSLGPQSWEEDCGCVLTEIPNWLTENWNMGLFFNLKPHFSKRTRSPREGIGGKCTFPPGVSQYENYMSS